MYFVKLCVLLMLFQKNKGDNSNETELHGLRFPLNLENITSPYKIDIFNLNFVNSRTSTKIIGGFSAEKFQFPYQAAIFIISYADTALFCGGSLITSRLVITAAHCIFAKPQRILVLLGSEQLYKPNKFEVRVNVDEYIIHNRYSRKTLRNDICLLHLEEAVIYNPAVLPINLPYYSDVGRNYLNKVGLVSGFGMTKDEGAISTHLMYLRVKIMDNYICNLSFDDRDTEETNICSSGYEKIGACHGDSGGPLVIDNKLIGIVSFGAQVCSIGYPTVYTRVPTYLSWISYNTNIKIKN